MNHVSEELPLFVVFRALGIVSDPDILSFIVHDENDLQVLSVLKQSLFDAHLVPTEDAALHHIGALCMGLSAAVVNKNWTRERARRNPDVRHRKTFQCYERQGIDKDRCGLGRRRDLTR
jgi:DNA-directed RNA polymerase beta subunit